MKRLIPPEIQLWKMLIILTVVFAEEVKGDDTESKENTEEEKDTVTAVFISTAIFGGAVLIIPPFIVLFILLCKAWRSRLTAEKLSKMYSLICWTLKWVYFAVLIGCASLVSHLLLGLSGAPAVGVFAVTCYFCVSCWESNLAWERDYISSLGTTKPVAPYFADLKAAQPKITWMVHTWGLHFLQRIPVETFQYNYWVDQSEINTKGTVGYDIARIQLTLEVIPGDEETERFMEMKKEDVFLNYSPPKGNWKEECIECRELSGHEAGRVRRMAVFVDMESKPFWFGKHQFWIASILGMTWPYRWYFCYRTAKINVALKKKVYMSRPSEHSDDVRPYRA